MAIYEILKKQKITDSGGTETKYLIRRKILGVSFYKIAVFEQPTPLPFFGIIILLILSVIALYFNIFKQCIGDGLWLIPLWYFWHFSCKKTYDTEYEAKKIVEAKFKKKLNSGVVIRYTKKGNSIEVDKFLD